MSPSFASSGLYASVLMFPLPQVLLPPHTRHTWRTPRHTSKPCSDATPPKNLSSLQAWLLNNLTFAPHLYLVHPLLGRPCRCSLFAHLPPLLQSPLPVVETITTFVLFCLGQCLSHTMQDVEWMNVWMNRWSKTLVSSLFSSYLWCPVEVSHT